MDKKRIYDLAKALHTSDQKVINKAHSMGIRVKDRNSTINDKDAGKLQNALKNHHNNHNNHNNQNKHAKSNDNKHSNNTNRNNNHHSNGNVNHHNNGNVNHNNENKNGNGNNNYRHNNKKKRRFNKKHQNNSQYTTNQRMRQIHKRHAQPKRKSRPLPDTLVYTDGMNAQDIGKILHRAPAEIVKKLFMLGVMVNQNQSLDKDTIELLATDYGINAREKEQVNVSDIDKMFNEEVSNTKHLENRAPVVTIMGHVDHGKTTLLDYLRSSHITSGEAGGITQDIGAYQLERNNQLITFLDTPGHAAFTQMRARGADMTDLTILVVAADDGVQPQTVEAIHHAQAAKTPIIVAINKIDKEGANPDQVINQLSQYNLIPEKWGGETIFVDISAKLGTNVNELLDMILLQAEVMELKANPDQNGAGSVVESRLDKGKGPVATLLVQQGTMHVSDPIVVGDTFGRVRTMTNETGESIKAAAPSTPVEITGLNDVPEAGDRFVVFNDEKTAREAGEKRAEEAQMEHRKRNNSVTLDNLFDTMQKESMKELGIVIKADVQGSVEALTSSLEKIKVEGIRINIVHAAVGAINESDISLAEASNAIIIGFNVRPTSQASSQAESENVDIRLYQVIYNAIDEVESAMKGMLEPEYKEVVTGEVDVRQLYSASKVGTIAGGTVTKGYINVDNKIRLIRDNKVIYNGELGSLKRYKDDVKTVKQGYELGLTIDNYNDLKIGDVVESYTMKEVPRK